MSQEVVLRPHPVEITEAYDVRETLGSGHFSKVKLGIDRKTGEKVAIKIIKKPRNSKIKMLESEVSILTKCQHPHIVTLYKVVDTNTVLYLVMELLTGGELFDSIIAKGQYSERDTRKLVATLTHAIKYLHDQGIAHRDLKPENLLLSHKGPGAQVKITDFGLSKMFAPDGCEQEIVMKTACGTPGYVAPEVLTNQNYSSQVDMWSFGVIVYILLCGFPPFYGDNDHELFRKIKAGHFRFRSPYWDHVSRDAKDFISRLLTVDWKRRMTADQALTHTWLAAEVGTQPNAEVDAQLPPVGSMDALHESFKSFHLGRQTARNRHSEFRRLFNLPEAEERIGVFKCSLNGNGGTLFVTTTQLCFLATAGAKERYTLADLTSVSKVKRLFAPKNIQVLVRGQAKPIVLGELVRRGPVFNMIIGQIAQCTTHLV